MLLVLFREDVKSIFKRLEKQATDEGVSLLPSATMTKRWLLNDAIIGELTISCSAETSEHSMINIEKLLQMSLGHDRIIEQEQNRDKNLRPS